MAERIDRIGQRFGDYVLQRRLGGGSFGDVYLGEQVHEHSLAAVKVLHIRLTRSEDLRAFINEVRTFRLQHPHIVRMLDVGLAQDEMPFLVMAYAPGGTLRDRHPKGSRLSPARVLGYVLPIASALQYAHDLHLVHRDVKPENMLLGAREALWLSDFGIVTVAHSTHSLTTEAMGGTVPYMAPEQLQGRPRPQSDQYALAIVVYEWLTGTWPFRGTAFEIAMQHQMTPPPALRTYRPELAPEVEQVVLTALEKDPKQRFASVLAFARALEQASQGEPTLVEPSPAFPTPDATNRVLQEEQHLPAEEERVRQGREEKQASQVKQPEPSPVIPVSEMTDTNSSQHPTERATPELPMLVSQQTVREVSTEMPAAQTLEPTVAVPPPAQTPPSTLEETAPDKEKVKPWGIGKRQIIAMVIGIVIYSAVKLLFVQALISSSHPFLNVSFSATIASGLIFVVLLFFATKFGPWVGLVIALLGWLFGDFLVSVAYHVDFSRVYSPWYSYVSIALFGFLSGLAFLRTRGRYNTRKALTTAIVTSFIGIVVALLLFLICESIFDPVNWITYFQLFALADIIALITLLILLIIYDKLERYNTPMS